VTKKLLYNVVVIVAVIIGIWAYLFHGYISGSRWAWVKYKWGTLDSPSVILAKDGWLFTRGGPDDIDDYRGLATRGNRVIRLREVLTKRNEAVRSLGGTFLDVLPRSAKPYTTSSCRGTTRKLGTVAAPHLPWKRCEVAVWRCSTLQTPSVQFPRFACWHLRSDRKCQRLQEFDHHPHK